MFFIWSLSTRIPWYLSWNESFFSSFCKHEKSLERQIVYLYFSMIKKFFESITYWKSTYERILKRYPSLPSVAHITSQVFCLHILLDYFLCIYKHIHFLFVQYNCDDTIGIIAFYLETSRFLSSFFLFNIEMHVLIEIFCRIDVWKWNSQVKKHKHFKI